MHTPRKRDDEPPCGSAENPIHRFLHEQALARCMDLLEAAGDAELRARLRERLLEAAERIGDRQVRLTQVDALIARLQTRIADQETQIAGCADDGCARWPAERLRLVCLETLDALQDYRRGLAADETAGRG